MWSADGRELYFRNAGRMMVVSVETGDGFIVGQPRPYFRDGLETPSYDVFPDGAAFPHAKEGGRAANGGDLRRSELRR